MIVEVLKWIWCIAGIVLGLGAILLSVGASLLGVGFLYRLMQAPPVSKETPVGKVEGKS